MYDANSSEAYSALGLVYSNKKSLDEALIAIQKAITLDNEDSFAYWIRGRIYRLHDRDAEAADDFNKVLELNQDFHAGYADLQLSYEKLKDKDKLAETIQRALKFYPSYILRYPDDPRPHSGPTGAGPVAGKGPGRARKVWIRNACALPPKRVQDTQNPLE